MNVYCKQYYFLSAFNYNFRRFLNLPASTHFWLLRYYGNSEDNRNVQHLFDPLRVNRRDFDKIIEVASQFKNRTLDYDTLLKGKQACVITTNRIKAISSYLFMWKAAQLMGAKIMPFFIDWRSVVHKDDLGRMLSITNDIVLAEGLYCGEIFQVAEGSKVPLLYIACTLHHPLEGLAHVMTIREHFGEYDTLTFAWIGPANPTLNTYMHLLPNFSINIQYNCSTNPDQPVSPMLINEAKKTCENTNTKLTECKTALEAIEGADVIATTGHNYSNQTITLEMLKQANKNWMLTHNLPRGKLEIDDDVYNHKRNLAWQNFENIIFICMAIIKQSLEKEENIREYNNEEE